MTRRRTRNRLHPIAFALGLMAPLAGGAVLFPAELHAQGVSPEAQAQLRFTRGREQFLAQHYDQALVEFRAAQAAFASPNIRLYVARTLRELGRLAEAFGEFQLATAEATDRATRDPRYVATRDTARTEGTALEARLGHLTLRARNAPPGIRVTVGGNDFATSGFDLPTPVDPGAIVVVASAPDRAEYRRTVTVAAGQSVEVSIELPSVAPSTPVAEGPPGPERVSPVTRTEGGGVRVAGFVVAGLGLVGGVLTGVFGSMAQGRFDSLRTMCPSGCGPEIDAQVAEGQSWQLLANVSLVTGIVALGAGTVMILVGGPRTIEQPAAPRSGQRRATDRAALRVLPWGTLDGSGSGVAGVSLRF